MIQFLVAVMVVTFGASPALALNSNVNVSINTFQVSSDHITEVEVVGDDVYSFPDPFAAPDVSDEVGALATGLAELGYPLGTVAVVQDVVEIGTDETVDEVFMSSHNPIDDPTFVIGDPSDYSTWIAIGDEDVQVDVEITTTSYTFFRLIAALGSPCGNGSLDDGEQCDDGNSVDGDCCSAACVYETAGTACDDGLACTAMDTCDGLGVCEAGGPSSSCESEWAKASLLVLEKKAGKEKLKAKFKSGSELGQADFGNPVSGTTAYDVCVFGDSGTLVASMFVDRAGDTCAGKACWKAKSDTGWQYKDKAAASDGVSKVQLFGGAAGKSQVQLQAANNEKKGQLEMPTGIAAALAASPSATLQVLSSDALCFEATLDQIKKQTPTLYKASN